MGLGDKMLSRLKFFTFYSIYILYKKLKPIKSCLFPLSYPWLSCRITENSSDIIFMGLLFCIVFQKIPQIMEILHVIFLKIHFLKTLKHWWWIQIHFTCNMFWRYTMRLCHLFEWFRADTHIYCSPDTGNQSELLIYKVKIFK